VGKENIASVEDMRRLRRTIRRRRRNRKVMWYESTKEQYSPNKKKTRISILRSLHYVHKAMWSWEMSSSYWSRVYCLPPCQTFLNHHEVMVHFIPLEQCFQGVNHSNGPTCKCNCYRICSTKRVHMSNTCPSLFDAVHLPQLNPPISFNAYHRSFCARVNMERSDSHHLSFPRRSVCRPREDLPV